MANERGSSGVEPANVQIVDPTCFVKAGPFWRFVLPRLGLLAIVMPWRRCYVLAEHWHNRVLRVHEAVHLDQIQRHGPLMFAVLYLWWLIRHGYRENPFEVEAYEVSDAFEREQC